MQQGDDSRPPQSSLASVGHVHAHGKVALSKGCVFAGLEDSLFDQLKKLRY